MNASFEEKMAWITLVSLALVFGLYFVVAARMISVGVTALVAFVPLLLWVVTALVLVLAAAATVVAIASRPEGRDERDRLIEWRAGSNSGWVLAAGVVAGIAALAVSVESVWVAHLLLLSLLVSELLKSALQLLYYRRGV